MKNTYRLLTALFAALMLVAFASCSDDSGDTTALSGTTWRSPDLGGYTITFAFASSGNGFTALTSVSGESDSISGTYSLSGNQLTLTAEGESITCTYDGSSITLKETIDMGNGTAFEMSITLTKVS